VPSVLSAPDTGHIHPCNVAHFSLVSLNRGPRTIPIDLETVTEARLVAQALAGSQSAFEQIVRRYQRPVINLIARMTGERALAEDLAQETFVKAFRNLAAFDTTRRLSSWLFRIAHNTALDALRRSRPPIVPIEETSPALAPAGQDAVERAELGRALQAALNELRPEYRAAIVLRYQEGLSFEEIGRTLGIPQVTARTHVHRARKELLRRLSEAGWQPTQ
jgi:RNA polymerase sigma factor (sigma-70 family)